MATGTTAPRPSAAAVAAAARDDECKADDEVLKTVTFGALVTGAFAFVAALAWNDAIQRLITHYAGDRANQGAWAGVLYAFVLTLVIALLLWVIRRVYAATRKARCALHKRYQINVL